MRRDATGRALLQEGLLREFLEFLVEKVTSGESEPRLVVGNAIRPDPHRFE